MREPIHEDDIVMLREALPNYGLPEGRIGRIAHLFTPDEFDVKFVDGEGRTYANARLSIEQIEVLRHNISLTGPAFWQLIEWSKAESHGNPNTQIEILVDRLAKMSVADIFAFGDWFYKAQGIAYRCDLWAAASLIEGWCTDDGFTDFRAWLIAQGEQAFFAALQDPEILVDLVSIECDGTTTYGDASLEDMNYIHVFAYEKKRNEEMPFWSLDVVPAPILIGEVWDVETARQKYPKLAAKFEPRDCSEDQNKKVTSFGGMQ